jgi:perosamine synthetase
VIEDRPSTRRKTMNLPNDQDASGRNFGREELAAVSRALESGTLTSTKGTFVRAFEKRFAEMIGVAHAFACSSGTAAIHTAIAAVNPNPGDEFITTPVTDMGALTPILYQGAIPVFADIDSATFNVTARTIRERASIRTKGIIATHLFGNPCEMDDIVDLAASLNVPIIEDCAQAFLACHRDKYVGTIGTIGCFSLQQGKHITTGEGGIVVTNDDALARKMFLFINKAWGYGDPSPDHYSLALNYRMSELQGAVALAQLDKLEAVVDRRVALARALSRRLVGEPGILLPTPSPLARHTYWKYCLRVDESIIDGGAVGLARLLKEQQVFAVPRYIQKPAFACEIFRDQRTFGDSRYPFTLARPEAVDYAPHRFEGTYRALDQILVVPWNDRFTDEHVEYIAASIANAVERLTMRVA